MNAKKIRHHGGFTLYELLIGVAVLGIVIISMGSFLNMIFSYQASADMERNNLYNLNIRDAFYDYARDVSFGVLPSPYTGSGYVSTVYNPIDATPNGISLSQSLGKTGIPVTNINDDGTAGASVRVYQLVNGLTKQVPMFAQTGPLVTLTFQYGAIYMTSCNKGTASCNPNAATGIPGTSTALTAANYTTWRPVGSDSPAVFISSLDIQKDMLATSVDGLDKLRDKFLGFVVAAQVTALAGDATNFYPTDATSLAGQAPATNQGCRDGWYSLATTNILSQIGMQESFGRTAWGGPVEYCRDYDASGTKAPNAAPHNAALRIRASVSLGLPPDPAVTGNNVVLTF